MASCVARSRKIPRRACGESVRLPRSSGLSVCIASAIFVHLSSHRSARRSRKNAAKAGLPPAEIDFAAFPDDKPHIVGYRAKWDADSFEYHHTPRRFDFPANDRPLLDRLSQLAIQCWREFGLRGYARVDFRVDEAGRPWILEINANPCLSPDAGFAAAVEQAGIGYDQAIERIVNVGHSLRE